MAIVTRTCPKRRGGCGRKFRVPNEHRREFCEECRPPKVKSGAVLGPPPAEVDEDQVPRRAGELEVAVRAELVRADRAETWRGAAAIRLARECDTAKGSQVSSLIKQLEAAMAAALDGVPPEPDFVDEVAERRAAAKGA